MQTPLPTSRLQITPLTPPHPKCIRRITSHLDIIIRKLAQLRIIQTHLLFLGARPQRQSRNQVHQEQNNTSPAKGISEARNGVGKLVGELDVVLVEPAARDGGRAVERGYVVCGEEAGHEVADYAADAVDGEDVEGVVDLDQVLELGGEVAGDGADDAEDDGGPGWDVALLMG